MKQQVKIIAKLSALKQCGTEINGQLFDFVNPAEFNPIQIFPIFYLQTL